MRELLFHFDYVSPYAYLAWTQIHALADRHGARVRPVPTLFAALLGAHGTVGPGEVPAKRVYVFKDAYRKAHALGIPALRPPPTHPFNPLLALRVSGLPMDEGARRRLVDALYAATWAAGSGCESREAVGDALRTAGLDAEAKLAEAEGPEAKARLRAETDEAIAAGVFGVPTVRAEGEVFWGTDGLVHLEAHLRGEDPVPPGVAAMFRDIPASATRRR